MRIVKVSQSEIDIYSQYNTRKPKGGIEIGGAVVIDGSIFKKKDQDRNTMTLRRQLLARRAR